MTIANIYKRAIHFSFMALSIMLISACSGVGQDKKNAPTLFTNFYETAEYLLQRAEIVKEPKNTEWQLAAIQALTKESKYVLADSVIEYLQNKTLNTQQKNHLTLLIADNQYAQNQLDKAMVSVKSIDMSVLSKEAKLHYLKLKTDLHVRNKEHQAAADTLFLLAPILTNNEQKQRYNDLLLTQLNMLDTDVLNNVDKVSSTTDNDNFKQGWYALASVYHRYQLRTNQLIRGVDAWKLLYPTHLALAFMPSQLLNLEEATPYQPSKIAVLLPLTGRFKKPAQAIQYGISYAFYNQAEAQKQSQVEQESGVSNSSVITIEGDVQDGSQVSNNRIIDRGFITAPPHILFLDTNTMTMQEIATQLHSQHIDFVIGPLLKPNLKALLPLVKDIPVLALNSFPTEDGSATSSIHYAFPLSPEGEAEQAAEMIFQDKHKKPLLFAPNSDFGRRTSAAFEARWKELSRSQQASGNGVELYPAETHFFSKKTDYAKFLATALQTDKSKERNSQMQTVLGRKLETEIRSRADVDAIYIISKRKQLMFIKPFMSVAISPFAKEIPLYASSRSHVKDFTNTQDKELTGITFSDVAFLLEDKTEMNEKVQSAWPRQRLSTLRLFALGNDSYSLIEQLKLLEVIEGYNYQGLVGEITLDARNTIKSKLSWATFQDGNLVEATSPISSQ
ncbi:penicillin-binding protein activator [uncultured Psychromonas sp.]|uniref:penicillin-binding protein activator n=1 Tax=uncultured Psychromonas sp. TaxID=173974 RepID=UPI002618EAC9|nr:penicillin-binding protein activator [uncultured Psychromonas sp.]